MRTCSEPDVRLTGDNEHEEFKTAMVNRFSLESFESKTNPSSVASSTEFISGETSPRDEVGGMEDNKGHDVHGKELSVIMEESKIETTQVTFVESNKTETEVTTEKESPVECENITKDEKHGSPQVKIVALTDAKVDSSPEKEDDNEEEDYCDALGESSDASE